MKIGLSTPCVADGPPFCVSMKIAPKPPYCEPAWVRLSVSPVSSNANCENDVPGRKTPFSGRLNGVAFAALASEFESKLWAWSQPSSAEWIVTHVVKKL